MMELYIRIVDGQPFEHPIHGENFRQVFPHIDVNNLPPEFVKFERIAVPELGPYQIYENTTYSWDNGIVKDIHQIREMSVEEKSTKIADVISSWEESPYKDLYKSWTFSESSCSYEPPTPMPKDGKKYNWDELTLSWIEINL